MPEVNQIYNFNSLYIIGLIIIYNFNIFTYYEYIKLFISNIILLNYPTLIIFINIIGFYLFLKNVSFEINLKISYKKNTGI